jgi:hypothetical protein
MHPRYANKRPQAVGLDAEDLFEAGHSMYLGYSYKRPQAQDLTAEKLDAEQVDAEQMDAEQLEAEQLEAGEVEAKKGWNLCDTIPGVLWQQEDGEAKCQTDAVVTERLCQTDQTGLWLGFEICLQTD